MELDAGSIHSREKELADLDGIISAREISTIRTVWSKRVGKTTLLNEIL